MLSFFSGEKNIVHSVLPSFKSYFHGFFFHNPHVHSNNRNCVKLCVTSRSRPQKGALDKTRSFSSSFFSLLNPSAPCGESGFVRRQQINLQICTNQPLGIPYPVSFGHIKPGGYPTWSFALWSAWPRLNEI